MASDAATIMLTLVGIGVIVVGVLYLMEPRRHWSPTVIVREEERHRPWGPWRPRWGPYWAHGGRGYLA